MKKLFFCLGLLPATIVLAMQQHDAKEYIGDYRVLISMIGKITTIAERSNPGYKLYMSEELKFDFTEYQTKQGFFLEFRHGAPQSIYWRLGRVKFAKGFTAKTVEDEATFLEHLKQEFGLKKQEEHIEYKELHNVIGQVTSRVSSILCPINSHNQIKLASGILRLREKNECLSEESARKIYKDLKKY